MDRLACLDLAGFPIQVLVRHRPEWHGYPVALVAEDRPHADVLAVNALARRAGVLPGQRYATALALARDLRAGTLPAGTLDRHVADLTARLRRFSPDIEPAADMPGVFWINAGGLSHIFPSLTTWAHAIRADVAHAGFQGVVVVGFTRFGTYAVAKTCRETRVFPDPHEEQAAATCIPLAQVNITPATREFLFTLGVETVGDFLALPASALRARLDDASQRLHRLASGDLWSPLVPAPLPLSFERQVEFESPVDDVDRLVFLSKPLLDGLVVDLAAKGRAAAGLTCHLTFDDRQTFETDVRPAAPSLDAVLLVTLLRLRLSAEPWTARVMTLRVQVDHVSAPAGQLRLIETRTGRNLDAAARAFARLRAVFGDDAIVRARVREAHLPRARVAWEPVAHLPERLPAPRLTRPRLLVRRIFDAPRRLAAAIDARARDWLRAEVDDGRAIRIAGPYIVSGGWWRGGVHRDYYFLRAPDGQLRWVYYDRHERAWFLEGRVE